MNELAAIKTRVVWMLSSDNYATAQDHGLDRQSLNIALPPTPRTPGEARDSLQAGPGSFNLLNKFMQRQIAEFAQWEALYAFHTPELAIYARYVQSATTVP
ncbi:unnamed protein product [Symbiodinium sp. CCMP2592]|nr:unnamed protein product [Symbiodinium sp. CCMP2592]CAE7589062.1 unnamed protein product [Symbiodinium sp. CCMP2592]CAE7772343.1 unnamed protein product [Symbiodinium sp. CCMP2592]